MTSTRNTTLWVAGTGVLAVLILVATYFLLVAPKRAEAAEIATQTLQTEQTNAQIEQETARLESQFATLADRERELAAIEDQLPREAQIPDLLRRITDSSTASGVVVTAVTPGAPAAWTSGTDAADATGSATSGIVAIPLTVTTQGSFAQTELFVKQLQSDLGRFVLLQNVSVTAGEAAGTGAVTASVSGQLFVVRDEATTPSTPTGEVIAGTATTDAAASSSGSVN